MIHTDNSQKNGFTFSTLELWPLRAGIGKGVIGDGLGGGQRGSAGNGSGASAGGNGQRVLVAN